MADSDSINTDLVASRGENSEAEGSGDVNIGGCNPAELGTQLNRSGPVDIIQNIFPSQVSRAVPELEHLVEGLALSSIPQGASSRNIVNIVNTVNLTVGNTEDGGFSRVPAHIKERIEVAEKIFVKTVGYHHVRDALDYHGHVLICGSPGSGKTLMSLYIMGEYMRMKYNVVFLDDLSKFKPDEHLSQSVPTLLVFDDIFGYFSLTTKELVHCKRVFTCLKTRFKRLEEKRKQKQDKEKGGNAEGTDSGIPFKVIMNSRTNVWEMITRKLLEYKNSLLRASTIADLTTLTKLTDVEKEKILRKHLKRARSSLSDADIKAIANLEYSFLGFPHLCELFVDSLCPKESAVQFFKQPLTYLVNLIAEIFSTDESKQRAGVLLLIVLNDGVLSLVDLQSIQQRKERKLEEKLAKCEEIVTNLPSPHELTLAAKHENHTLLVCDGDIVKFSHPTIHDAVAFVVGDENPLFVLENCSLQFILERTKVVENDTAGSPSGGDFINFMINLSSESTVHLVKRLAREIIGCKFALPLSHHCFSSETMVRLLFKELSSFDNMGTCLHSADDRYGLGFLFWSSFISLGPLCEISFQHTSFNLHEILEGCFGCSMSGNVSSLRVLISHCQPISKITKITLGDIIEHHDETRSFCHSLPSVGSSSKSDATPEKETPRMHGDNSDLLIHIAAANGFSNVVQVLLELGTEIDICGGNKMTALMHACYLGHSELVRMLLASGSDPTLLDEEGDNCLHLACRGGSTEVVKLLHEKIMDLDTHGEHDRTPLMYASYNGHEHIVEFLLEEGAMPEPDLTSVRNKENCLHLACVKGHTHIVRILLEQGHMNIEMHGEKKRTPIMYACRHGKLETAKELAKRGADVRVVDSFNFTCLHVVSIRGHISAAEWLLSLPEFDNVDCCSKATRRTPLMLALQFGQTDMVQFLLKKGANIGLKDIENSSCLHFAVKSGVLSLVDLCLDAGLDINYVTATGLTPAIASCRYGYIELLTHLVERGADIISVAGCLHSAAFGGHFEMVKYLTSQFTNLEINKPGYRQRTPIMNACSRGFIDIAKYLMDCGADVRCKDEFQQTCLHIASRSECPEMVKWLLSLGLLAVDDVDVNGYTPLMYAVKYNRPGIRELLVQNGADTQRIRKH